MKISQMNLLFVSLSLGAMLVGASCSSKHSGSYRAGSTNGAKDDDQTANLPDDQVSSTNNKVEQLSSAFGLLNFRQMTATYATLTGVNLSNAAVAAEYTKQLGSLPREYAPAQISAAKVSAATKLAANYCDVLSTTPALLTAKFPGLNLATPPADSSAFAKALVDGFYGPETALQGPRAADIASVAATVDALKGLNGTGQAIFMASCAAVLASAEFFLY